MKLDAYIDKKKFKTEIRWLRKRHARGLRNGVFLLNKARRAVALGLPHESGLASTA